MHVTCYNAYFKEKIGLIRPNIGAPSDCGNCNWLTFERNEWIGIFMVLGFCGCHSETKFLWTIFAFKYYITSMYTGNVTEVAAARKWFCYLAGEVCDNLPDYKLGMTGNEQIRNKIL